MENFVDLCGGFPVYSPDIDDYAPVNCSYIGVDELSVLISGLSLSIFMMNIRSCMKNFNNFLATFCNYFMSFTCMIFTETWLTPDRDKIFNIPGFYCYDIYRSQYGGGIKIYLKDGIQSKILKILLLLLIFQNF